MNIEEQIKRNAELVIRQMEESFGITLSYNQQSVAWLDDYIAGIRENISHEVRDNLIQGFGSFFGECIRRQYGGEWNEDKGQWAVAFDADNAVFPFTKVRKHFEEMGESILDMYTTIPLVFKETIKGEQIDERRQEEIAPLLEALQIHEYFCRKYRFQGDAYYEYDKGRRSYQYHGLAAEEEKKADDIAARLEAWLGPRGEISRPAPEEMELIRRRAETLPNPWSDKGGDFDEACFFARYPRWARFMEKYSRAYEQWKDDPRFFREAPRFWPMNPSWRP